ncbi:hypothetical protein OH492_12565 [Vibrio chagasii]|nr:hypothetical protein [Vibrio chagasii]
MDDIDFAAKASITELAEKRASQQLPPSISFAKAIGCKINVRQEDQACSNSTVGQRFILGTG